jgi:7-keto-8-aminopelargonate synthetase-like enzyme
MKKSRTSNSFYDSVNEHIEFAKQKGIVHLYETGNSVTGRTLMLENYQSSLVNFGSCSYLGLEFDARIVESGIKHLMDYGSQFSSSRAYVSIAPYKELEGLLYKIFNRPLLISQNSTLGHLATIPAIIEEHDAIILDHQAHISMHHGTKLIDKKVTISLLRHSRLDELEEKIHSLKDKHNRIWYFIDGVYSMYGDVPQAKELIKLLDKHPQLYLYVDDAHGMSWTGENGKGYFLNEINELHSKMILATSLAKGFGSAGGVFIFPNEEWYKKVKTWGGPLTYSGPQQPATIGCSIASAKIHLSSELKPKQESLMRKILLCNKLCEEYELPLISNSNVPIKFIGVGLPKVGYNLVHKMMNKGYYVNLGVYPAVPETCTGIRFTITDHLTEEDIVGLCTNLRDELPRSLHEENRSIDDVYRSFKSLRNKNTNTKKMYDQKLILNSFDSIGSVDRELWNSTLGDISMCDYNYLAMLESSFHGHEKVENNWKFKYYIVKNDKGEVILATLFTLSLIKNDLISSEDVSRKIEEERQLNPYYLTSLCFMMGTTLTEGNHLYINKEIAGWKKAIVLLLDEVWKDSEILQAEAIYLRDFNEDETELQDDFINNGFVKIKMPKRNILDLKDIEGEEKFISSISSNKRNKLRKDVLKFRDQFVIKHNDAAIKSEIKHIYDLYKMVKNKSLLINTFDLPIEYFKNLIDLKDLDIISIRLKGSDDMVAIGFAYVHNNIYYPIVLGLNYNSATSSYRQLLYNAVLRAISLKCNKVSFGFTADEEKNKLNAKSIENAAYILIKDDYKMRQLNLIESSIYNS